MRCDSAVGFYLDRVIGKHLCQPGQRRALEERFATRDDQPTRPERGNARRSVLNRKRNLVGLAIVGDIAAVGPCVALEAPSVGGVAPTAGKVAAAEANERAVLTGRR